MQFKQANLSRASINQSGFTLIELIVVIVILGILAATALPKFADMGADARRAKMQAARGAVSSAVAITRSQWLATGDTTSTTVTLEGTAITVANGYPAAGSIAAAAGLDAADYNISGTAPVTIADARKTGCSFTYSPANGTVSAAPAITAC